MAKIKVKSPLESAVQNTICEYLTLKRAFFWRQNTAPTIQKNGDKWSFRRMPKYAIKGVADIIVIGKNGQAIFLEVKRVGVKQSPEQKEFQIRAELKGAIYHVVSSLDDVVKIGL